MTTALLSPSKVYTQETTYWFILSKLKLYLYEGLTLSTEHISAYQKTTLWWFLLLFFFLTNSCVKFQK